MTRGWEEEEGNHSPPQSCLAKLEIGERIEVFRLLWFLFTNLIKSNVKNIP
jgi:hypothetical protein